MELKTVTSRTETLSQGSTNIPGSNDSNKKQRKRIILKKSTKQMETFSYSRVGSKYQLSDWIERYCIDTAHLKPNKRNTFVDSSGIERYADNWQAIHIDLEANEELTKSNETFFLITGCMRFSSIWDHFKNVAQENQVKSGIHEQIAKVLTSSNSNRYGYLKEWQKAWIYLEGDDDDEVLKYTPLFRLIIECLFHPRIQKLLFFLVIYNIVIYTILRIVFPYSDSPFNFADIYFHIIVKSLTYFAIVKVYHGKLSIFSSDVHVGEEKHVNNTISKSNYLFTLGPDTPHPSASSTSNEHLPSSNNVMNRIELPSINSSTNLLNHFRLIRKELISKVKEETQILFAGFYCSSLCMDRQKRERYQAKHKELLEIHHNQKKKLLSYHDLMNISLKYLTRINGVDLEKTGIDRLSYRLALLFIIFFVPLYYLVFLVFSLNLSVTSGCAHGGFDDESCIFNVLFIIFTFGEFTIYFVKLFFAMSILVALASLAYGAEIAYRLINEWIIKVKSLRKIEEYDILHFLSGNDRTEPLEKNDNDLVGKGDVISALHSNVYFHNEKASLEREEKTLAELDENPENAVPSQIKKNPLLNWVKCDVTEHYLFICEVFAASDKIWSQALTGIFILGSGIVIFYVYGFEFILSSPTTIDWFLFFIGIALGITIFFIYPLVCICYANSYIFEMKESFKQASEDDYQLIGGGKRWLTLMTLCPVAWTFHGLWITWERLFAVLWTIFGTLLVFLIRAFDTQLL